MRLSELKKGVQAGLIQSGKQYLDSFLLSHVVHFWWKKTSSLSLLKDYGADFKIILRSGHPGI